MKQQTTGKGVCDAHDLIVGMCEELKDGQKDIVKEMKEINKYIIGKQAENGVTTVIAQKQDTKKDSNLKNILQILMMLIAITAIIVGALH